MNKSTPRRNVGKPQPKRPKLDFSAKSFYSAPIKPSNSDSGNIGSGKYLENTGNENPKLENLASTSDFDDEFSSEMLQKVCLIADLSPSVVNYEPIPTDTVDGDQKHGYKRTVSDRDVESNFNVFEEIKNLKLQNEKLTEIIKTKEGEVQILRSQLKQNQEVKHAEALNNKKLLEEAHNNYKQKLESVQKEYSTIKTELEFKELELKSFTERWKHLESNALKMKLVEPQSSQLESKWPLFNSTQVTAKTYKDFDMYDKNVYPEEEPIAFKLLVNLPHEGRKLGNFLCPQYFSFIEEPCVISLYKFNKGCGFHISSLDFDKREKYKWSGLPKQTLFVKDTYDCVSKLFLYESFAEKEAKILVETVLDLSMQILYFQRDLLYFLVQLQEKNVELDDSDYSLVENEEEVYEITINSLLDGKKINKEECGIESRRILAMIVSLILSSQSALHSVIEKTGFVILLKELAISIGNLRKPIRYTGILASITLILTKLLDKDKLEHDLIILLNEITEEIIFARPKLDVLTLVVEALAVGRNHKSFVQALCRKGSVESCALYMDSKLHQAMFFTKDACPLRLLCTQIMGLSCIPVNREMRWNVTRSIIKWLNNMMTTNFSHEIKWLPTASQPENKYKCFDVMECFVYLLNSCLKDYMLHYNIEDKCVPSSKCSLGRAACKLLSVIGDGCLLFRRILKLDLRLLHRSTHNLRFVTLLKSWKNFRGLLSHQKEAATWIVELVESGLNNQEGCVKQNASNISDKDFIDALKISDDLIIF